MLTCLREGCTIDAIGERRLTNATCRPKSGYDLARLFHRYPGPIRRTVEIAEQCAFQLDELRYHYPDEALDGEPAQARPARPAREGLDWRYPSGPPPRIVQQPDHRHHCHFRSSWAQARCIRAGLSPLDKAMPVGWGAEPSPDQPRIKSHCSWSSPRWPSSWSSAPGSTVRCGLSA
ncbi:hypothetical protein [Paracoccus yeei]|uniref:hypothetical protein n=1 Tax=Paracoccus yeei TaxID=147645 RepID=UPI0012FD7E20|nr:hypothetical protein [Paracoccus yeei]